MKKIIRWIADVSGVTRQIQIETCKQCGHSMKHAAYWWTGGLMHKDPKYEIYNAFTLYSEHLELGHFGHRDLMGLREKVYKTGQKPI